MAVLILTMYVLALPVSAASPTLSVGANTYQVNQGDVITVSVNLSANSNLGTLDFDLTYNTEEFEFVTGSNAVLGSMDAVVNPKAGRILYRGATAGAVTAGGPILTVKFKVLKHGGVISISNISATDGSTLDGDTPVTVEKVGAKFSCAHKNLEWKTTKEATCTAKGTKTGTCACGYTKTEDIPMTDHKFSKPVVTKKPTCTEEGIEEGKCSVCGKTTQNKLKATGHKWSEWVVTKQPTFLSQGEQERTCLTCAKKETKAVSSNSTTTEPSSSTETSTESTTESTTLFEELDTTTKPTLNYYEIETEPTTAPSGGLFGGALGQGDLAVLLIVVLAVLVVIVVAVYILLIIQRKKR